MNSNFFETNSYFIDEKVNFFKFENCYQIYNEQGANIGSVKQKLSAGQKFLRLLLKKPMLPFLLEIRDSEDRLQASISRGWTFWMSKITITNPHGKVVGTVKQKFKFFKPTFNIFDASDSHIAKINGDWKAWNFHITDPTENQIGAINKKWNGAMKEIFTTADKYNVTIHPEFAQNDNKVAILAGAITIDMVLKESK